MIAIAVTQTWISPLGSHSLELPVKMTIIFYDIPSTLPNNVWSPNTWKTRFCLNLKGLDYKTEWVEFPDIEGHCIKLGIAPTGKKPDGSPYYTLPAIHDPSTGVYLSNAWDIAVYLEKTYPDTPRVFPANTAGLQLAFETAHMSSLGALWFFILPALNSILNPVSEEYFRRTRESRFKKKMEELAPTGDAAVEQWAKYKDGLGKIDSWYAKSSGPFLIGDTPSWADFSVGGFLIWLRLIWGEDSQQWKDITSWQDSRWKNLMEGLKKYETLL